MSDFDDPSNHPIAKFIKFLAKSILVTFWFIIGLPVWIALVIRAMIASVSVATISLLGYGDINKSFKNFERVAAMWSIGLNKILSLDISDKAQHDPKDDDPVITPEILFRAIFEIIYAVIFFSAIYFLLFGFPELNLRTELSPSSIETVREVNSFIQFINDPLNFEINLSAAFFSLLFIGACCLAGYFIAEEVILAEGSTGIVVGLTVSLIGLAVFFTIL